MSLATLARKTKEKQRQRSRGNLILNMTGRGKVHNKFQCGPCGYKYNKVGTSKCTFRSTRSNCCNSHVQCKEFPHGGVPAPQMGYGVYLNKKTKGEFRPSGGVCCKNSEAQKNNKKVWKNINSGDASDITMRRKYDIIGCNADVYTQPINANVCAVKKNMCGCHATDLVRYTRINHNKCGITKAVKYNLTASDQITKKKSKTTSCKVCKYEGPLKDGPEEECGTLRWAVKAYLTTNPHGKYFEKGNIYSKYGTIENWDVSNITDMSYLFSQWKNEQANLPLRKMLVSKFNADISRWDVSNVETMRSMFNGAETFNQDVGSWGAKVGNVKIMKFMFYGAKAFNNNGRDTLKDWDVSNVETMQAMFYGAEVFNQDVGSWATKVGNVKDMGYMFRDAKAFNNNGRDTLKDWDVSNVETMQAMFDGAEAFNQDVGSWGAKVGNVKEMDFMFWGAKAFNNNGRDTLKDWDVSNVETMRSMFNRTEAFNQDVGSWGAKVGNVKEMDFMFQRATAFNNNGRDTLKDWDVSNVETMQAMFHTAEVFNQDVGSWGAKVGNVKDMGYMFRDAKAFNNNGRDTLKDWDVSPATVTIDMFLSASALKISFPLLPDTPDPLIWKTYW